MVFLSLSDAFRGETELSFGDRSGPQQAGQCQAGRVVHLPGPGMISDH